MKNLLGLLMIIGGVALGLYVGLWLMFIGGIVGIIEIVQSGEIEALPIALNIAKVFFATFVGTVSAYTLIVPGFLLMTE